ncbi:MAG TPA: hypothetical protein VFO60_10455, partial [Candidatus Dormibacteraeota bacterium]|nr:hypothetical protein [Candidatus Dormibacteraeota bacterium]
DALEAAAARVGELVAGGVAVGALDAAPGLGTAAVVTPEAVVAATAPVGPADDDDVDVELHAASTATATPARSPDLSEGIVDLHTVPTRAAIAGTSQSSRAGL